MTTLSPALECRRLTPADVGALLEFLGELEAAGDAALFHPHPFTAEALAPLADPACPDLYYLLREGQAVLGYGLLRGWAEGYAVPSLGIAIRARARGQGLGRALMLFLHAAAARRGADRVRLRVRRDNGAAIALYKSLGYDFAPGEGELLVGTVKVGAQ